MYLLQAPYSVPLPALPREYSGEGGRRFAFGEQRPILSMLDLPPAPGILQSRS